jgi:hypothetical protein
VFSLRVSSIDLAKTDLLRHFRFFFLTCSTSSTLQPGGPDTRCGTYTSGQARRCSRTQWFLSTAGLCLPASSQNEQVVQCPRLGRQERRISDTNIQRHDFLGQAAPQGVSGTVIRLGAYRFSFLLKSLLDSRVHIWCYFHGTLIAFSGSDHEVEKLDLRSLSSVAFFWGPILGGVFL